MWDRPGQNKTNPLRPLPQPPERPWTALPLETRQDFRVFFAVRGVQAYRVFVYPGVLIFQIHPRFFSTLYNEYDKKPDWVVWIVEPLAWWREIVKVQVFDDRLGSARMVEANHGVIYRDS